MVRLELNGHPNFMKDGKMKSSEEIKNSPAYTVIVQMTLDLLNVNDDELNNLISYNLARFKREHPNASENDIRKFIAYNFNQSAQKHSENESEDRILSYEPYIANAHEYILSILVLQHRQDELYLQILFELVFFHHLIFE